MTTTQVRVSIVELKKWGHFRAKEKLGGNVNVYPAW